MLDGTHTVGNIAGNSRAAGLSTGRPLAERETELHRVGVTEHEIEEAKKRLRERGRGYLFPQRVGTGSDYERAMNDLHHAHERALKASRIEPRFRIYDLHHTYGPKQKRNMRSCNGWQEVLPSRFTVYL